MQPYPRSPDLAWPGQLHGTGCLSARSIDTGLPTVVWPLCLGPVCGWMWVWVTPPALAGVLGGFVWVRFVVSSPFCRLGFVVFVVGLGFWPAPLLSWLGLWDVRGCVRALPAPRRSRFRCAVWACVLGSGFRLRPSTPWGGVRVCMCSCARPAWSPAPPGWGCCAEVCGWCRAPPLLAGMSGCVCVCACAPLVPHFSWLGCAMWASVLGSGLGCAPPFLVWSLGCVFLFFWWGGASCLALWCRSLGAQVPGLVVSVSPSPLFRAALLTLFFFPVPAWCVSAHFGCPFSRWAAAPGLVLPVLAGWSPCAPSGGPHNGGRHPPRKGPPPPSRHAAPTGHASQGDSVGPPHPHTRAHSTWVADPDSPPSGRAVGGGTAPDLRRPSQRWKAPPRGRPSATPQRTTQARKGARCGARAGSPRPHRPRPGHMGRGTLAARSRGRAAGGGTAPDIRRPSQGWQAIPPGDGPPPPPRHAAPTGHAGQGDSVGPPNPHTRAHGTRVADPNSPPSGRAVGGGTAPDLRRPSQWWKAPPSRDALPPPHSEQRRLARAHAVGLVLGPHVRTDRTRKTRVAEP